MHKSDINIKNITLSICQKDVICTDLTPETKSFEEWSEFFSKNGIGPKEGAYFIRGKAPKRCDDTLAVAEVAVLDGDSSVNPATGTVSEGAPPLKDVHEALRDMGVRHIIYTSHSHGLKGNRYRVIVPAKMHNKQELAAVVDHLISELHLRGVYLNNVKENYSWSQPWYLPRVPEEL